MLFFTTASESKQKLNVNFALIARTQIDTVGADAVILTRGQVCWGWIHGVELPPGRAVCPLNGTREKSPNSLCEWHRVIHLQQGFSLFSDMLCWCWCVGVCVCMSVWEVLDGLYPRPAPSCLLLFMSPDSFSSFFSLLLLHSLCCAQLFFYFSLFKFCFHCHGSYNKKCVCLIFYLLHFNR